jgi:hypothetical protein
VAEVRTNRSFGVTAKLDNGDRSRLADLISSEGYPIMLDVMEQTIIEMESDLINTPVGDRTAVFAKHQKVQAAWQVFTHLQQKLHDEVAAYNLATTPPTPPRVSEEDAAILQVTEPFNEYEAEAPAEE